MDENGLFFCWMSDKTVTLNKETCHGGKRGKDQLLLALCCNSDGFKN